MNPAVWIETVGHDLRYAGRIWRNKLGYALVAVISLALGIGANTAIFSVVNASILTPVPVPAPERVVMVWTDNVNHEITGLPASIPDFLDWRSTGAFESLAGFDTEGYNLLIGSKAERVDGVAVTKEWFDILRAQPRFGRLFRDEDMRPGHDQVVVVSESFWTTDFNADPAIVGRAILVNGSPRAIIGVLPGRVVRFAGEKIYVPLLFEPPESTNRGLRFVGTVGRLSAHLSLAAAQNRMSAVMERLRAQYPHDDGPYEARLQPIEEAYVQDVRRLVLVLFGGVGFVLLIACANVANLLLVHGAAREREMAIRAAIGGRRLRLIRQLLTESLLLALPGVAGGSILALFGIRFLVKFGPAALPNPELIRLNSTVLLFALVLGLCTGIIFGTIPAYEIARTSMASALQDRSRSASGRLLFRNLFVIGEVALTVILVAGALLMARSFVQLRSAYPGYDVHTLTMRVSLAGRQYESAATQIQFYKRLMKRIAVIPGVRNPGGIDCLPTCTDTVGGTLHFTDRPQPPENEPPIVIVGAVTPDYFRAMGIPLVRGRYFSDSDDERAPLTVILDQGTAHRYWPHDDPVGRSIKLRMRWPSRRIVGIVGDIDRSLAVRIKSRIGQVYVPATQMPAPDMSLAIATVANPASVVPAVRREVASMAPDAPVFQVQTTGEARAATQTSSEFGAWVLGFFALLSLLLAAIGVYGVIAYSANQRVREIGIRIAIGATPWSVLRHMLREGLLLISIGLAGGIAGAFILTSTITDLLHGLSRADPVSLVATILVIALVGVVAALVPAYRASRVDPLVVLRYE